MPLRPGIRRLLRLRPANITEERSEVDAEMQLHIDLRAEQLMGEGMEADAARGEARRMFVHSTETMNALYTIAENRNQRMRIQERWESWQQDVRYAARGLLRDPLLTVFIVVTLALGVGGNVTAFGLVERLLMRGPAHIGEPERLVLLYARVPEGTSTETSSWIPYAIYRNLHSGLTTLDSVGAFRVGESLVGRGRAARKTRVGRSMGAYFGALGVQPLRGRFLRSDEDVSTSGLLAIISEDLWRAEYAADPAILGKSIFIEDEEHTIIGVAPAGFAGIDMRRVDVWAPADARTAGWTNWHIIGRLPAGGTIAAISAQAHAVHRNTRQSGPAWMREAEIFAAPIGNDDRGREPLEATMARWLAIVSGIILLITFANVVNLLIVRVTRHRRELAVRVALGAGRARVMRLLALEGVLLALASGVASLLVARAVEPIVRRALFADEAAWTFRLVDAPVLITLFVIMLITAIVVGVIPALQAGDPNLASALRSARQGSPTHSRVRSALTIAQAALSVVLLVGAGLFVKSLANVRSLDLGADADEVIVAVPEVPLPPRRSDAIFDYIKNEPVQSRRWVNAVRVLPGVASASIAVGLPLDGGSYSANLFNAAGDSIPTRSGLGPYASVVTTDYFATVGTAIVRGRAFDDRDREGSELVIIVNETLAQRFWPGRDPIGECVFVGRRDLPCRRVVGVAQDVHRVGLSEDRTAQFYLVLGQPSFFAGAAIVVRPNAAAPVTWEAIQKAMLDADATLLAVNMQLLVHRLNGEMRPLRLGMVTFGLSATLALLVAVLGLYSVMSYLVAWRTREIGVRVALGATNRQITRLVVASGTTLAAAGTVLGLAVMIPAGRLLEPHLFQTSSRDPLVFAAVAAALLIVALLAGWIPALRALRINPTEALRAE
jgi:predicted permease